MRGRNGGDSPVRPLKVVVSVFAKMPIFSFLGWEGVGNSFVKESSFLTSYKYLVQRTRLYVVYAYWFMPLVNKPKLI